MKKILSFLKNLFIILIISLVISSTTYAEDCDEYGIASCSEEFPYNGSIKINN